MAETFILNRCCKLRMKVRNDERRKEGRKEGREDELKENFLGKKRCE